MTYIRIRNDIRQVELGVMNLRKLHATNIRGSVKEAIVPNAEVMVCKLSSQVSKILSETVGTTEKSKVFVTTRMLKHLYDKKPAEEYDFILDHLSMILKYPDHVFRNKGTKRGDFVLLKNLYHEDWLCSIELTEDVFYVATAFRVRRPTYLDSYDLMWSWKVGAPSS